MRILHVISNFDPVAGGPPRIAIRLACAQAAAGHDVSMLAYDFPDSGNLIDEELKSLPGGNRIQLNIMPIANRAERLFGFAAKRELKRLVPGQDFVHVHNIWETISPSGCGDRASEESAIHVSGQRHA